MKAFIKFLDEKVWRSIFTVLTNHTIKDSNHKVTLKPKTSWSPEDDRLVNYNSKALHAIFNGVKVDQIKLIVMYEYAKEAWYVFKTTYEGTNDVKHSKLLRLSTRFKELRMHEDEFLSSLYANSCDISHEVFALI